MLKSCIDRLRGLFRIYDADETDMAGFRARQLQAVLRLSPMAMLVNIGHAVLLAVVLHDQVPGHFMPIWAALVTALALWGFRGWWRHHRTGMRPVPQRVLSRAVIHATGVGLAWAVLPAVTFAGLATEGQFLVAIVTTGMICAGGCMLAPIPWASTSFTLTMGAGAMLALASWGTTEAGISIVLMTSYVLIVLYAAWTQARKFGARLQAEAQAEQHSAVIGLLLRDVEDQGSDLLWELDERGRFTRVSQRLAQALGVGAARLQSMPALRLLRTLRPPTEEAHALWAALVQQMAVAAPFRDALLELGPIGAQRWWSFSARPLRSPCGRLIGWRGVATDITDKHLAHQRLHWLAHNDALTGLANRTAFHDQLRAALALQASAGTSLAVVIFDLDGFKQTNDAHGHAAGDQLLQAFGTRLQGVARRSDTVARLGGDEFGMLVRDVVGEAAIAPLLARVLASLDAPLHLDGVRIAVRASMGVAFAPRDGTDSDQLLTHADIALYTAKRAGGSRFQVFLPQMADASKRRSTLEQSLRGAVARGELRLVYQPQVSADAQRLHGFEALLRWQHPEFGEVPPEEFVGIAERSGLMPSIGAWVLEQACREAQAWPADLRLSVNVSPTQLSAPGFVELAHAASARLPAERVELEVTETALMEDADAVVAVLTALRAMGYRIALDDFGTGYSALGYLRLFRFDTLKIDKRFVRDLSLNSEAQVIVDTIVAMAGALKMATVAEGVESRSEASLLALRGCDLLQGYLVSRPLPPDAATAFWQAWDTPGVGLH